jgi:hypothetical protein
VLTELKYEKERSKTHKYTSLSSKPRRHGKAEVMAMDLII